MTTDNSTIVDALRDVTDPDLDENIVSTGLVTAVRLDAETARVELGVNNPGSGDPWNPASNL